MFLVLFSSLPLNFLHDSRLPFCQITFLILIILAVFHFCVTSIKARTWHRRFFFFLSKAGGPAIFHYFSENQRTVTEYQTKKHSRTTR
jgi:hypothetical protein